MRPLKIAVIVVSSLLLVGGAGYLYASSGIKSNAGYASLVKPVGSVDTLLSLNVGPRGVQPARWLIDKFVQDSAAPSDAAERMLKTALQDLQGVQLHVYEVGGNQPVFDKAIADSVAKLTQKSWQILTTVRDEDVKIAVLHFADGPHIAGLSIMASTPEKAVFLNLVGPFDYDGIADSARQF